MGKKNKTSHNPDHLRKLHGALINELGKDKDVTMGLAPFMKFNRNGLDLNITFGTTLDKATSKFAHKLCKHNMFEVYEESGYGWDDDDKREELMEHGGCARFLVVRDNTSEQNKPVAFVHFRFTLQGELVGSFVGLPMIYVYDVQLNESVQGKGLGKHLMNTLTMIARREQMYGVTLICHKGNDGAKEFFTKCGYVDDDMAAIGCAQDLADDGTFDVMTKAFAPPAATSEPTKVGASSAAAADASSPGKLVSAAPTPVKGAGGTIDEEEEEDEDDEATALLKKLTVAYQEKNGRLPTADEMRQWMQQITEASQEALANGEIAEDEDEEVASAGFAVKGLDLGPFAKTAAPTPDANPFATAGADLGPFGK